MLHRTRISFGKGFVGLAFALCASAVLAQGQSGYSALVGVGQYAGYNNAYNPYAGSQITTDAAAGTVTMRSKHDYFSAGQIKIFVPPGSRGPSIQIFFGYANSQGQFINLGCVW